MILGIVILDVTSLLIHLKRKVKVGSVPICSEYEKMGTDPGGKENVILSCACLIITLEGHGILSQ